MTCVTEVLNIITKLIKSKMLNSVLYYHTTKLITNIFTRACWQSQRLSRIVYGVQKDYPKWITLLDMTKICITFLLIGMFPHYTKKNFYWVLEIAIHRPFGGCVRLLKFFIRFSVPVECVGQWHRNSAMFYRRMKIYRSVGDMTSQVITHYIFWWY